MNLTNYHSHCNYCDGQASVEEFVKAAIEQGFTSYGISSHAPLPFRTRWAMKEKYVLDYLAMCACMKELYSSQIDIYTGLEIDYLNDEINPASSRYQQLALDYRIGSVHMLYDEDRKLHDIDCQPEKFREIVDTYFEGNLEMVIRLYIVRILRMVSLGGFDILGHADKVFYNASHYHPHLLEEDWYNKLIREYFETIAEDGRCMVEINTKAYRTKGVFFPNQKFFGLLRELGIQVLVNSDAHYPMKINEGRKEALLALKEAGFKTVMELHGGYWEREFIKV